MRCPWEYLIAQYEFMIVFTSFRRNIIFYSCMDDGQLRLLYSQIVSFSPARILTIDSLVSIYNKRQLGENACDYLLNVPCDLSRAITLAIGNSVPEHFVHECISECNWKGYEAMVLATFASADTIRSGALKYLTVIKGSKRNRQYLQIIISLAVTGWMVKLSEDSQKCTCGTWDQAVELISCFVPDTETTLTIQDEARVGTYICNLLDLNRPPPDGPCRGGDDDEEEDTVAIPLDYGYLFSDLLVSGLDSVEENV